MMDGITDLMGLIDECILEIDVDLRDVMAWDEQNACIDVQGILDINRYKGQKRYYLFDGCDGWKQCIQDNLNNFPMGAINILKLRGMVSSICIQFFQEKFIFCGSE